MDFLHRHIEALIFCSPSPLGKDEIHKCLSEMFEADVPLEHIDQALAELQEKYKQEDFSFALEKLGGGYQFLTKPAYQTSIAILLKQQSQKRLSTAQMETLSIIAYKQPVTKGEIEQIRGVNCDYSVQKLLEKELVEIKGKSDQIGRPLIYGTSPKFMEYFGINSIQELPQPKDFSQPDNQIGEERE
ncbi:MAG TPA: SMC-Scp complex subunit ScpB [Algoriphagus sp.]|uniref:Segregation and condensation protein B n=1 Tax=Algoriphagus ornithinivorans TaxID=226506 RepID=A0A1I5F342_9BACT|nr:MULTISPECIES: SMC-Scp complex subunit ScpB [Algoriphagus]MAL15844.1 SMC-Scp complex subunit ScpB [Algoriphagus sp.]MAN88792.1 SMC-Scp complex subunit ScpB [Algoriphagus sp.]QYH40077.1 SMC-Scp complex subunit ScpB [Algoriphagus sp. NBT04N3]SFO18036.1 segregation and condensation protein B [Algoriphagus ornithinivorans]HAH37836.1 SMC-Scp complex subunit ScpB [Algoriphagus sp.]